MFTILINSFYFDLFEVIFNLVEAILSFCGGYTMLKMNLVLGFCLGQAEQQSLFIDHCLLIWDFFKIVYRFQNFSPGHC